MEYRDYKTGKSINRKEYIKNGLERGKLLLKESCGCVVIQDRTADAYIVYCPQHVAAPELVEALKEASVVIHNSIRYSDGEERTMFQEELRKIAEALAKAGGKW